MTEMKIDIKDDKSLKDKNEYKFIPIKDRLTSRFLTKYERAKIIGERAIQINNGSEVYVDVPNDMSDSLKIAEKELKEKKIPFIIRRYLPNGDFEDWELNELIFD